MNHRDFAQQVDELVTARVRIPHGPIPDGECGLWEDQRNAYTKLALQEIKRGKHGPTWATTALKMWNTDGGE